MIPIDGGNDLFNYVLPETPLTVFYSIRVYEHGDEKEVYSVCYKCCLDGSDCSELFPPGNYNNIFCYIIILHIDKKKIQNSGMTESIPADRLIGPFLTINPEFCMVIESNGCVIGYACAALDAKHFYRNQERKYLLIM